MILIQSNDILKHDLLLLSTVGLKESLVAISDLVAPDRRRQARPSQVYIYRKGQLLMLMLIYLDHIWVRTYYITGQIHETEKDHQEFVGVVCYCCFFSLRRAWIRDCSKRGTVQS